MLTSRTDSASVPGADHAEGGSADDHGGSRWNVNALFISGIAFFHKGGFYKRARRAVQTTFEAEADKKDGLKQTKARANPNLLRHSPFRSNKETTATTSPPPSKCAQPPSPTSPSLQAPSVPPERSPIPYSPFISPSRTNPTRRIRTGRPCRRRFRGSASRRTSAGVRPRLRGSEQLRSWCRRPVPTVSSLREGRREECGPSGRL